MDVNAPESMAPWLHIDVESAPAPTIGRMLTVGEVASLVGISVRTLHHWDSVGLVHPHGRTNSGYRTYSRSDVERIHRVLVYKELGFSLTEIASLLDDPAVSELAQLRQQRRLLAERIERLQRMADALDGVLSSLSAGRQNATALTECYPQEAARAR